MKPAALLLVAFTFGLAACAPLRTAPRQAADVQADAASMDSRRDIVLAVANPIEPPAMHAGSSLLGYAAPAHYGAGQRAAATLDALEQHYGWREMAGWPIKALKLYCIVLRPPPGTSRETMLQALGRDARVALAEPLHDYATYADPPPRPQRYNDPYAELQRGFVETDAALAHDVSQGRGTRVAVVDTGVDLSHPELEGHIGATRNLVDEDAQAFRGDRHGTEVAGVIVATGNNRQGIVGIAPDAAISVYKACWYPGPETRGARCNSFTLAKALAAVLDTDARIVNLSLGGPADALLGQLLGQLLEQGRIVVAAMPPGGSLGGFPDNKPGVLVVRVTAGTPAPPGVLGAPGHDILSTEPGGGYDFSSGSSMAAAHVSGIVALLLALDPRLSAQAVQRILLDSSKRTPRGLQVDAAAAVARLRR
jgi:hypothetical protein